jgi:hypothetical protein
LVGLGVTTHHQQQNQAGVYTHDRELYAVPSQRFISARPICEAIAGTKKLSASRQRNLPDLARFVISHKFRLGLESQECQSFGNRVLDRLLRVNHRVRHLDRLKLLLEPLIELPIPVRRDMRFLKALARGLIRALAENDFHVAADLLCGPACPF